MAKLLSIDTEATGLEEDCYLVQFGFVPIDSEKRTVEVAMGRELWIKCPTFEELKPKLNPWVIEHNESIIRKASEIGLSQETLRKQFKEYLQLPEIKYFFGKEKPLLLGKSLSALDIRILNRYLGFQFMQDTFHHHTLDITSVAHYLTDSKKLPAGCEGTSKIIKHLGIREEANHTALSDAIDMGKIYLKLLVL